MKPGNGGLWGLLSRVLWQEVCLRPGEGWRRLSPVCASSLTAGVAGRCPVSR